MVSEWRLGCVILLSGVKLKLSGIEHQAHNAIPIIPPIHTPPNLTYPPTPPSFFFFLSSTNSILSSGTTLYFSNKNSSISSLTSPWTTISSPPLTAGFFVTLAPVANFLPRSLATFLLSRPKASRPETAVTYLRLLRSTRLMVTFEAAIVWAAFASAASAFNAFLCASFSARLRASTERVEVAAARASLLPVKILARRLTRATVYLPSDQRRSYISSWAFWSHSWHFLTVPPNSQYYLLV